MKSKYFVQKIWGLQNWSGESNNVSRKRIFGKRVNNYFDVYLELSFRIYLYLFQLLKPKSIEVLTSRKTKVNRIILTVPISKPKKAFCSWAAPLGLTSNFFSASITKMGLVTKNAQNNIFNYDKCFFNE